MDVESLPSKGKNNLRRLAYEIIDERRATVPRMHAAIADLELKKLNAEKELIEFEKATSRSEGVLHHLAAQRFHSVIDIQVKESTPIHTTQYHCISSALHDNHISPYHHSTHLIVTHTHPIVSVSLISFRVRSLFRLCTI